MEEAYFLHLDSPMKMEKGRHFFYFIIIIFSLSISVKVQLKVNEACENQKAVSLNCQSCQHEVQWDI